jgi:methyl-accepting chemotaxis protein
MTGDAAMFSTRFRDLPIRLKLLAIIALAAALGLVLNLALFGAGDLRSKRTAMQSQLDAMARIVSDNSVAALRFDDAAAAEATLAGLNARPEIVAATITRPDGRPFARYPHGASAPMAGPTSAEPPPGLFRLQRQVRQDNEVLGVLTMDADLAGARRDTLASLTVASLTSLLAFAIALLLAVRLQRSISQPLLDLAKVVEAVATDGDRGRRVRVDQGDEIGHLAGRFNAMLSELQTREAELQQHRDRL